MARWIEDTFNTPSAPSGHPVAASSDGTNIIQHHADRGYGGVPAQGKVAVTDADQALTNPTGQALVWLYNAGPGVVYVKSGAAVVVADDWPLFPNQKEAYPVAEDTLHVRCDTGETASVRYWMFTVAGG